MRASAALAAHAVHLSSRLQYLLASGVAAAVHRVVHHAGIIELTVGLAVERVALSVLAVHGLGSATR